MAIMIIIVFCKIETKISNTKGLRPILHRAVNQLFSELFNNVFKFVIYSIVKCGNEVIND